MIHCTCDDWESGAEKINAVICFAQVRVGHSVSAGYYEPWKFCPWCGSALVDTESVHVPRALRG